MYPEKALNQWDMPLDNGRYLMTELAIPVDDTIGLFDGDSFGAGYSLPGFTEVDKAWMIGVPHVIVRVTYWVPKMGIGHCSIEAYSGTAGMIERAMRRNKIPASALAADGKPLVEPEEAIVYSDGSTGVRRQVTKLLNTYGLIDVGHAEFPEEGQLGESRYDVSWAGDGKKEPGWESFSGTRMQGPVEVPCIEEDHNGNPLRIKVVGGLQVSEYSNRDGIDGLTYYLR